MARKVVLAGACRTAIGTMGGTLSTTPAPELGTIVIREALKRAGLKPEQVDEVYMGCVIQAGLGQNPARQAAVNAGIPVEVPATTINVLCGSGLHCVNLAAKLIASGDADIIVAGGMENMSKAPYLLYDARFGYRMGAAKMDDALLRDALQDAFGGYHMGITAENIAQDWGLTREQLDEFAAWSQNKCEKAQAEGKFKEEIVPVEVKKKKETILFDTDEVLRSGNPVPSDYMPWIHMFHPAEPSYKDIPPRRNNPASYRSVFQIPYLPFLLPHSVLSKIRPDRFSVSCCKPVSALPNTLLPACVLNP